MFKFSRNLKQQEKNRFSKAKKVVASTLMVAAMLITPVTGISQMPSASVFADSGRTYSNDNYPTYTKCITAYSDWYRRIDVYITYKYDWSNVQRANVFKGIQRVEVKPVGCMILTECKYDKPTWEISKNGKFLTITTSGTVGLNVGIPKWGLSNAIYVEAFSNTQTLTP